MDKQIKDMTGPELVQKYNEVAKRIGEALISRFSSRDAGVRRVEDIIKKLPLELPSEKIAKSGPPTKGVKNPRKHKPRYNFCRPLGKKVLEVNEESAVARVRDLLKGRGEQGALFSELKTLTGWRDVSAYRGTLFLASVYGYGLYGVETVGGDFRVWLCHTQADYDRHEAANKLV